MKKSYIGIRIIAGICAVLGWWGLFYPELALTPDTVKVFRENRSGIEMEITDAWEFDSTLFRELLTADEGTVQFRSKLLTELCTRLEAESAD